MNRDYRNKIIMGLFLICTGLLFLLSTTGIINLRIWLVIAKFWPVLIIFMGLNLLLVDTRFWWLLLIILIIIFMGFGYYLDSLPGWQDRIIPFYNYQWNL